MNSNLKKFLLIFLFTSITTFAQVRGVWLTNVDSKVLNSKDGIKEAVELCKEVGINNIYVVVWNKGFTLYPSKVMDEKFGVKIIPDFAGRDPLKDLIEEAHKHNIKVTAWFEFGFSSSYMLNGGMIIKQNPDWAAKNSEGQLVVKNGFEWMNGFNPEVQQFMLSLIMEVVNNYDVDGIQGDDRLPAMPSEAGYDDYTKSLYMKSHNGALPPENHKDSAWVQWRADILNGFMKEIYTKVKAVKNIKVSMAPSLYPWSKEEYLQDWPYWINNGFVDEICPQLYRYNVKDYEKALLEIVNTQIDKDKRDKFFPGILLKVGKYIAPDDYLKEAIKANRKAGIKGEVYFFYEGLPKTKKTIKKIYNTIK